MPRSNRRAFLRPTILNSAAALGGAAIMATVVTAGGPPISSWDALWQQARGEWALADLAVIDAAGATYVSVRPEVGGGNGTGLLKYGADGTLEWAVVLEEVADGSEGLTDLEITPEGVSMVGIALDREGAAQTLLLNYASDGSFLWEARTIGPVIPGFLQPQLAIGPAGERVIATDDGNGAGALERYDATGTLLSATPLSFSGFGGVSALELDATGAAVLVSLNDFSTYSVEKFDAAGDLLWAYADGGDLVLSEAFMAIDPAGDVVVTGSFEVQSKGSLQVVSRVWRLDSDGAVEWTHDSDQEFAISRDLALGTDGAAYVIRSTTFPTSEIVRIDAAGAESWTRSFVGEGFTTSLIHVKINTFGDVIVDGADSSGVSAIATRVLSYSPAGDLNWTGRVAEAPAQTFFNGDLCTGVDGRVALAITQRAEDGFDLALTVHLRFGACAGDLDGNGDVGSGDLSILITAWGPQVDHPADLDADGEVGISDLIALFVAWGPCA